MKKLRSPWVAIALGMLAAGCGSGNQSPSPVSTPSATGKATFTVQWPAVPSRLIPAASNSVKFVVSANSAASTPPLAGVVVNRPSAPPFVATATLDNLPVGTLVVSASAYPLTGAQGVAQAAVSSPLTVQQGQTTALTITMNSTITHIDVTPVPLTQVGVTPATLSLVVGGQSAQAVATPRDAAGNPVVVVPGNIQWLSDNPAVATVDPSGPQVTIRPQSPGVANITVIDTESASANPANPPTPGKLVVTVSPHVFSLTGSMAAARTQHTATLLSNTTLATTNSPIVGNVLVVGGSFAELYNPATGAFSPAGSLTTARERHTATLLANGTVLIAGGNNGTMTLGSAEIFTPSSTMAAGTFMPLQIAMTTPREFHTATLLASGKVLLAGGFNGTTPLASAEIYDPTAGTFTATGPMSTPRARQTATLLNDGTVLIAGGTNGTTSVASAEVFDPTLNSGAGGFRSVGMMNSPRDSQTATLLASGMVLVAGGFNDSTALATADLYDPTTMMFRATMGKMSTPRARHTATLLPSGHVLLAGGTNGTQVVNTADIYDPTTDKFTPTADAMNMPREWHTATLLLNGQVLITGGDNGASPLASAELSITGL